MKLEQIIKLRMNNFEITPPDIVKKERKAEKKSQDMIEPNPCWEGWIAYGTKIVDGKEVPNCVPVKEGMKVVKEGFPVPSPSGGEDEQTYISRCMKELNTEFPDQAQRAAVCYSKWREK